jgi:hypothetical protein
MIRKIYAIIIEGGENKNKKRINVKYIRKGKEGGGRERNARYYRASNSKLK